MIYPADEEVLAGRHCTAAASSVFPLRGSPPTTRVYEAKAAVGRNRGADLRRFKASKEALSTRLEMRRQHWIARDPNWDYEPPDGVRMVGVDRFAPERADLPDIIIRHVRTEVEQYRDLIASYVTPASDPLRRDAASNHA